MGRDVWVPIYVEKSNIMHILHSKIIRVCINGGKVKEGKRDMMAVWWRRERD